MKKVLIEMERLRDTNSGLGQFCINLGKALVEKAKNIEITYYLPKSSNGIFGAKAFYFPSSKIDKIRGIDSPQFSVCHCTHQQSVYLPRNKNTKLILTIHDLNFLYKYKSQLKRKIKLYQLQKKINKASALVFISSFTEKEVKKHLNIPNIPTKVIYNGNTLQKTTTSNSTVSIEGKYVFSIGIIQPKKNFHTLLSLLSPENDLKLVLAGKQDDRYSELIKRIAFEKGISDKVIFTGNIDEETKYHLYKNCYAFAFPSLSEGFGLPLIEAMSLGKPVFSSRFTSLPEIGGPEAFYFEDFSEALMRKTFKEGMKIYEEDPEKRARIKKWSEQFTWENAAEQYLQLYNSL